MDLWDFFWLAIWWFFFIAYLMMLFSIYRDLFRDHELGGGMKALWCAFLIFMPFLGAFVYLIARGNGMARRSARDAQAMQSAQEDYIRSVAGGPSPTEQVAQAKQLLDSGTITADEFARLKAKALA